MTYIHYKNAKIQLCVPFRIGVEAVWNVQEEAMVTLVQRVSVSISTLATVIFHVYLQA